MTTTAPPDVGQEKLLSTIAPFREQIDAHTTELERLYEARAGIFLAIREADPSLSLARIAAAAGISVPAVIQQISKAKARREERG